MYQLEKKQVRPCRIVQPAIERTGFLENLGFDSHLLGKGLARLEALHQATAHVVLAVPFDFG